MHVCTKARNDYTGGQQKQTAETHVYRNKKPVSVLYKSLRLSKKTYMKNLQNVLKYRHFILDITICKIYSAFIDDIDTFDDKC